MSTRTSLDASDNPVVAHVPSRRPSPYQRVASRLARPSAPGAAVASSLFILALPILGLLSIIDLVQQLRTPIGVFKTDFVQMFVFGKAIAQGANPYVPLPELTGRYLGRIPLDIAAIFPHPSPHPPTLGFLTAPISALGYANARMAWLGLELLWLVLAVYLLGRALGYHLGLAKSVAGALVLTLWPVVYNDVEVGQLSILLLLLATGAWLSFRSGKHVLAGALVGVSLLVKQVLWPLVVLLLVRRYWRAAASAVGLAAIGYAAINAVIGSDRVLEYLTVALPMNAVYYKAVYWNISLWTAGWRFFGGTVNYASPQIDITTPLIYVPELAAVLSVAVPALLGLAVLMAVRRKHTMDVAFAAMVCTSILISPIAWDHYLVLAAIPAALAVRLLAGHGFPFRETTIGLMIAIAMIPGSAWERGAYLMTDRASGPVFLFPFPFSASLLMMMPSVAVLGLAWFVLYLDRGSERPECVTDTPA